MKIGVVGGILGLPPFKPCALFSRGGGVYNTKLLAGGPALSAGDFSGKFV
jgi:hypothetical protein